MANTKLASLAVSIGNIENGIWHIPAGQYEDVLFTASVIDAPVMPENEDPVFTQSNPKQALEWRVASASDASLVPGYELQGGSTPTDKFGRNALFEPLGIDVTEIGNVYVSTRTAACGKL